MNYDVMDFVQPNVKKIINEFWSEDKARQFIKQIFLREDNVKLADYRWKKLLVCEINVFNVEEFFSTGVQIAFKVIVANSITEMREATKSFERYNTDAFINEKSVGHIDPEVYKRLEEQLGTNN